MSINRRIIVVIIFTLIVGLGAIFLLPKEATKTNAEKHLRLGAGDDTSGLLLKQIKKVSEDMGNSTIVNEKNSDFEAFKLKDC